MFKLLVLTVVISLVVILLILAGITLNVEMGDNAITIENTTNVSNQPAIVNGPINLAIIGDINSDLNAIILSENGKTIIASYAIFKKGDVRVGSLNGFQVILLTRNEITRTARDEIIKKVSSGTGLIIVQDGGYAEDDELVPWNTDLGNYLPIKASVSAYLEPITTYEATGKLVPSPGLQQSKLFEGYTIPQNNDTYTLYNVIPTTGSEEAGFIEMDNKTKTEYSAILVKHNALQGTSVYFAYNPTQTPAVLLNAIDMVS